MEEILQILLLLAYLAIGLMSITIPTYAISVSYLARETLRTIKDMEKRRRDLSEKLDELKKKLKQEPSVTELKREIRAYEEEEKQLKDRLECLSAKGAVGYPFGSFASSLFFAALGVYIFPKYVEIFIIASALLIGYGLYRFAKSLLAIEQAALAPEERLLPTFRIAFESGATVERYKVGEQKDVVFIIHNYGKEIAEDVVLMIFFPPDFKLEKKPGYSVVYQSPPIRYPNYNAAIFREKLIHVEVVIPCRVSVKMPQKPDVYQIPVSIRARKVKRSDYQLSIEIVS